MRGCASTCVAVLLLGALALPLAAAQPWPACDSSAGNYSARSSYETNFLSVIDVLRANASSSPILFAAGAVGKAPDTVYGLMLCRGDLSSSDCFDCGTFAGQDVQRVCNRSRDVALCYNQCYVRLSDANFLASGNNSGEVPLWSGSNITGDVAAYDRTVTALLNATAQYAVENTTRLFATGHWTGPDKGFPSIYSMAQCTPDLSPASCRSCLQDLLGLWWQVFLLAATGARIAGTRCNLRAETQQIPFYTGSTMLQLPTRAAQPPAPAALPGATGGKKPPLEIILPIVGVAAIAAISLFMWIIMHRKRRSPRATFASRPDAVEDLESVKSTLLSLSSLQVATNNFDENHKLGEGGFGAVYKGVLGGEEVAVKRMSKGSHQGLEELKNELVLVAKLHHKNLVRLMGFSLEEGERLLVYEYMSNKSLDTVIFDPKLKGQLDWAKRFKIIEGVARGLQYLHQDSQKKIIHRDLKASNVLLDADMNPKIGDFGLARLFAQDQTREVTSRIVGTFGYMSPEYVMRGQYSTKSDVFSFGVLVIEIVTGRRNNSSSFPEQNEDIISIVWRHWSEGAMAEMVDYSLGRSYPEAEVLRCVAIGLLCLQQNPADRPSMADILVMLDGADTTAALPMPAKPTFFFDGGSSSLSYSTNGTASYSTN